MLKLLLPLFLSIACFGIPVIEVEAATLKEIKQRGKLIVAVKDNLPPLGSRDRSNNFQGLEIDIAQKLATEIFGNKPNSIEFVSVLNQDRLRVLLAGKVDLTIARLTITPTRSRVIDFSRSYYTDGTALLVKQPQIKTTSQLNGKSIAVLNNSSTVGTLQYILPQTKSIGVDTYTAARSLLDTEKVSAFSADFTTLQQFTRTNPNYRILSQRLSTEFLGIAMSKGIQNDELRQLVDRSLQTWKTNGWLQQRIKYWGL
jgi:polar amino acid transport system substrate-binding protein